MPLKFKVGDAVIGRTTGEKGVQGTVVAIVEVSNRKRYKVRWVSNQESILTANSICTPDEFALLSTASRTPAGTPFLYTFPTTQFCSSQFKISH